MRSYVVNHWKGRLPLKISFWVNGVALSAILALLANFLGGSENGIGPYGISSPSRAFLTIIAATTIWSTIVIWQTIGIWRSASIYGKETGLLGWEYGAKGLALSNQATMAFYAVKLAVIAYGMADMALGMERFDKSDVRYVGSGNIVVNGHITSTTPQQVDLLLQKHPEAYVLQLNSPGGRLGAARRLRDLVSERELTTLSIRGCISVCTIPFLAGKMRVIQNDAKLGFRKINFLGLSDNEEAALLQSDKDYMLSNGISESFVKKAFADRKNDFWMPSLNELGDEGFVSHVYELETGKVVPVAQYCAVNECGE